jgi:hypothetical protein
VVTAKRTQVEEVAKTIIIINTGALKIETTNKFEKIKSLKSAPTTNLSKAVDV